MPPGIAAQAGEGLVHRDARLLGDHPLGLLDHDPAVEGQCSCSASAWASCAARCCTIAIVATSARAWAAATSPGRGARARCEKVQRRQHPPAQAKRERVGGPEAGIGGDGREAWPEVAGGGQVLDLHGSPARGSSSGRGPRSFWSWKSSTISIASLVAAMRPERALPVGEQEAGGDGVEELDAALAQARQQVDHVEVLDEGVGELDRTSAQGGRPGPAIGCSPRDADGDLCGSYEADYAPPSPSALSGRAEGGAPRPPGRPRPGGDPRRRRARATAPPPP